MNIYNKEKDKWVRPWELETFDDLYESDERFFSIVIKGMLAWLNKNVVMYNKPIRHFIFNTGSAYMYVESNGYEFSWNETTGEDWMYMQMPRCLVELDDINVDTSDLSNPFCRGIYERRSGNIIKGYNAEIMRMPIEMTINLKYVCSNFNESIVILQEILDKLAFQQYFKVTYLGQVVECSIEFPTSMSPELNKIDMTSADPNQKSLAFSLKLQTNYPVINDRSEAPNDAVMSSIKMNTQIDTNSSQVRDKESVVLKS